MQSQIIQHTLAIFERMYNNLPPLVSLEVVENMAAAIEQIRSNYDLTLEELEDTMIVFGKKVWPYMRAFEELYHVYEGQLGERLFLQKVSPALLRSYEVFKTTDGVWRDLYSGAAMHVFTSADRLELHGVLVDVKCDIRAFAAQAVITTARAKYETRIQEFKEILDDIELRLQSLQRLSDEEPAHPGFAAEIREHIRGFEYSLAYLGPQINYRAVCSAHEHFQGRKLELRVRI